MIENIKAVKRNMIYWKNQYWKSPNVKNNTKVCDKRLDQIELDLEDLFL